MKNHTKLLCAAAGMVLGAQAWAQTYWTLGTGSTTSGGVTMTTSGWANTGAGETINQRALETPQQLTVYSGGLGMKNRDACGISDPATCDVIEGSSPEHSIDNNERYEMVLLSFNEKVNLTSFRIGWAGGDSDMTVMAYTGTGAPDLAGKTWGALGTGWGTLGTFANYANVSTSSSRSTGLSTYSSYWLIGAYNNLAAPGNTWTTGNDYVKLLKVWGSICKPDTPGCTPPPPGGGVPEPGTVGLLALGLAGMAGFSRRRKV